MKPRNCRSTCVDLIVCNFVYGRESNNEGRERGEIRVGEMVVGRDRLTYLGKAHLHHQAETITATIRK
jgi:hypothetical protein